MGWSITPINAGPLDLGKWKRNCEELKSEVIPPKPIQLPGVQNPLPPNTATGNVTGGLQAASIFGLLGSAVSDSDQANAQNGIESAVPGFRGSFILQVVAEPIFADCGRIEEGKQSVGWAYFVKVNVRGQANGGVLKGTGSLALSFGPFSKTWEHCNCVEGLEPQFSYGEYPGVPHAGLAGLSERPTAAELLAAGQSVKPESTLPEVAMHVNPFDVRSDGDDLWVKIVPKKMTHSG